jgi:hypothetical protein
MLGAQDQNVRFTGPDALAPGAGSLDEPELHPALIMAINTARAATFDALVRRMIFLCFGAGAPDVNGCARR